MKTMKKNLPMRCSFCGKFVSYKDLDEQIAFHYLLTPDSLFTNEEFETQCKKCVEKHLGKEICRIKDTDQ